MKLYCFSLIFLADTERELWARRCPWIAHARAAGRAVGFLLEVIYAILSFMPFQHSSSKRRFYYPSLILLPGLKMSSAKIGHFLGSVFVILTSRGFRV